MVGAQICQGNSDLRGAPGDNEAWYLLGGTRHERYGQDGDAELSVRLAGRAEDDRALPVSIALEPMKHGFEVEVGLGGLGAGDWTRADSLTLEKQSVQGRE